jgi:hypothetical protein
MGSDGYSVDGAPNCLLKVMNVVRYVPEVVHGNIKIAGAPKSVLALDMMIKDLRQVGRV